MWVSRSFSWYFFLWPAILPIQCEITEQKQKWIISATLYKEQKNLNHDDKHQCILFFLVVIVASKGSFDSKELDQKNEYPNENCNQYPQFSPWRMYRVYWYDVLFSWKPPKWKKYACKIKVQGGSRMLRYSHFWKYKTNLSRSNGSRDMTSFVWKSCNS